MQKEYTIDDIPKEFVNRIYPAQCEIAEQYGFVFEDLLALAGKDGGEAEGAKKAVAAINGLAVRRVVRQVMAEAEEAWLDHVNDEAWLGEHRDDAAQKLNREFKQGLIENEIQKIHTFEAQCESLQDYRNPPDDVMSIPYDETDPAYNLGEINFLAQKTGRTDLQEQARKMWTAIDEAQNEEDFDKLEKAFMTFARKARADMNASLVLWQKNIRCIRSINAAIVLRYLFFRAHTRTRRSPSRSCHGTGADSSSGDADSDPEPPKPNRRRRRHVTFRKYKFYRLPSPWLSHGCCCVERGRAA
jgi:hypothetical protein